MAGGLRLEVATPTGLALKAETESIQAPSEQGELGVLPGHRPLLATMRAGVLRYTHGGKTHVFAVGPGFLEIEPDHVEVLTDTFKRPEEIDRAATAKDLAAAQERQKSFQGRLEGSDYLEIARAIEWAEACLSAHAEASRS